MNYDGGYHLLFSHPRMIADLLAGFIDEPWVPELDLSSLERVNAKFHADGLERRDGDVVWRLRRRSGGHAYLYMAIEFQSTVDPWMALRLAAYVLLLYLHLIREGLVGPDEKLPPVYPVVLFNGEPRWTAKRDLRDLIAAGPDGRPWPWLPRFRYHVLEERWLDTGGVAIGNITAVLFALEQCSTVAEVAGLVERLAGLLRDPGTASLRRAFVTWLKAVLAPARGIDLGPGDVAELSEVQDMLANRVREWTQEWLNQGRVEGEAKGRAEGEARGEAKALIRLLEKRFGPLAQDRREMILTAAPAQVELWFDRAIDSASLESVFNGPSMN